METILRKGEIYWAKKDKNAPKYTNKADGDHHPIVVYEDVVDKMDHFKAFILTDHPTDDSPIKDIMLGDGCFDTSLPVHNDEARRHAIVDFGYIKTLSNMNLTCVGRLLDPGLKKLDEVATPHNETNDYQFVPYTLMEQVEILTMGI